MNHIIPYDSPSKITLGFPDVFQVGRPCAREALQRRVAGQAHAELLNHLPPVAEFIALLVLKNGGIPMDTPNLP